MKEEIVLTSEWFQEAVKREPGTILEVDEVLAANLVAAGKAEYVERPQRMVVAPYKTAAYLPETPRAKGFNGPCRNYRSRD